MPRLGWPTRHLARAVRALGPSAAQRAAAPVMVWKRGQCTSGTRSKGSGPGHGGHRVENLRMGRSGGLEGHRQKGHPPHVLLRYCYVPASGTQVWTDPAPDSPLRGEDQN